ncbi:hypothetical protein D3C76_1472640 [compost metagenome]
MFECLGCFAALRGKACIQGESVSLRGLAVMKCFHHTHLELSARALSQGIEVMGGPDQLWFMFD